MGDESNDLKRQVEELQRKIREMEVEQSAPANVSRPAAEAPVDAPLSEADVTLKRCSSTARRAS